MSTIPDQTVDSSVQIYYVDPKTVVDANLVEQMTGWLDQTEIARLGRFAKAEHRHTFLVSHALTRKALGKALGCRPVDICFELTGRNKPVLASPSSARGLHFNLTHTQGLAVVAVGPHPMGIDAEWLARKTLNIEVAKRYFTEAECADIQCQPVGYRQRRFLTYWTLKEALLKAQAWGIVDSLNGFEFELGPTGQVVPERIRLRIRNARLTPTQPWRFHHWQVGPDHLVSLAISARLTDRAHINLRAWTESDWS